MQPFVGREDMLSVLQTELGRARTGSPRIVAIEADGGFGKSSLLNHFCAGLSDTRVVRAAGEKAEQVLSFGLVGQLLGGAPLSGFADSLSVGSKLLRSLDLAQERDGALVVVIDDFHWADQPSVAAVLFALRRLGADRVLVLISSRPGAGDESGERWRRFVAGDPRAQRMRLGGLDAGEVGALAMQLGLGRVPPSVCAKLVDHTGGSPLHCRSLLEELGADGIRRTSGALPAPRAFATAVRARVDGLSSMAQRLVAAAAVLGEHCALPIAAQLAGLGDPVAALDEATLAGILTESGGGAATEIVFNHSMIRAAVYQGLGPFGRRAMHKQAATLVPAAERLEHRVYAASGADDQLVADLEQAAEGARDSGQVLRAALLMLEASALCSRPEERERVLIDALELHLRAGDVDGARAIVARFGQPPVSLRYGALLGELDLLAGRGDRLEARMSDLWARHASEGDPASGARVALVLSTYLEASGRVAEALLWLDRALAAEGRAPQLDGLCRSRRAHCDVWLRGTIGLEGFGHLPNRAEDVTPEDTDALVIRGQGKMCCDDLFGALADLGYSRRRLGS